jgi:hypothetical protein
MANKNEIIKADSEEVQIIEQYEDLSIIHQQEGALIEQQITTAKKFPRDVKRSTLNALAIATMDEETAMSCGYRVPRGGKEITGASVHLARIIAQNWGNLRVGMRVIGEDAKSVIAEAFAWDLENNVAIRVEVKRSILTKKNVRYGNDLITLTGMAAASIAFRNAVFSVVPKSVTTKIYKETRNLISGDVSTIEKFQKRKSDMLSFYKSEYKVEEEQILRLLKIDTVDKISKDDLIKMLEISQAIKDKDTTVEEVFNPIDGRRDMSEIGKKQ